MARKKGTQEKRGTGRKRPDNCGYDVNTDFDGSSYTITYDLLEEAGESGTAKQMG
jgi:hypothetical protein